MEVKRAPRSLITLLAGAPGVAALEGRVIGEGRVEWPKSQVPGAAHVLSLPTARQPELNRLRLTAGRWPDPIRRDEVVLHIAFASAWNVRPGDALTIILNGRCQAFQVVGIAQSPDFVLASRAGSPQPDDRGYAVVGTRDHNDFAARWLAYMLPCRRFADVLADACAGLGVNVGRYSFIAVDFHHILLAGLPAHSLALRPAHSRRHLYVTSYTEGFSHFVTSMTAPVASGWSVRRVGLAPTGKRRLSRRTP